MKFIRAFTFIFFFIFTAKLYAEEFIERSMTMDSVEAVNPVEAKKEISEKIIKSISEAVIVDLIGEEKMNKSLSVVNNKIIYQAQRYIAFQKNSEVIAINEKAFRMTLSLKISIDTLKTMLNSNGLLGQSQGRPIVFPFIGMFNSEDGSEFNWWTARDERAHQNMLAGVAARFENALQVSFMKDGLYLIRPLEQKLFSLKHNISAAEDFSDFAQKYESALFLTGRLTVSKDKIAKNRQRIDVKIQAIHVKNKKLVTEIVRSFEIEVGKFDQMLTLLSNDLSGQINESWQKGSAGANVIGLVFKQHVPPKVQEQIKEKIKSQIVQVGLIRERLITSESVTFELGSQSTAEFLVSKMNGLEINGKVLNLKLNSPEEILAELSDKKVGL